MRSVSTLACAAPGATSCAVCFVPAGRKRLDTPTSERTTAAALFGSAVLCARTTLDGHGRARLVGPAVAVAAVAVQVSQHGAFGWRRGRDARRLLEHLRRQIAQPAARHERPQIEAVRGLGMGCERIAVGRKLKRAESEHGHRRAFVARAAIGFGWDRVRTRACSSDSGNAIGRREHRVGAGFVPDVRRIAPRAVLKAFDEARLHAVADRELLPQPGAARERPCVGLRGIDRCAGRQRDPAPLGRSVRPQRILGRKREHVRERSRSKRLKRRGRCRAGAAGAEGMFARVRCAARLPARRRRMPLRAGSSEHAPNVVRKRFGTAPAWSSDGSRSSSRCLVASVADEGESRQRT